MNGTLIRYKTAPNRADENQQLIEKVFEELQQRKPEGVRYMALRLADGAFVHFVVKAADSANPIYRPCRVSGLSAGHQGALRGCPRNRAKQLSVGNYGMLRD